MGLAPRISRTVPRPEPRKREGDSRQHVAFVKSLPCLVCGRHGVDHHHLKVAVDNQPKGMGRKHVDRWAIPACRRLHRYLEAGDDEARLIVLGISGREIAAALWRETGNTDAAERILFRARQNIPSGVFIPCFSDVLPSIIPGVNDR